MSIKIQHFKIVTTEIYIPIQNTISINLEKSPEINNLRSLFIRWPRLEFIDFFTHFTVNTKVFIREHDNASVSYNGKLNQSSSQKKAITRGNWVLSRYSEPKHHIQPTS